MESRVVAGCTVVGQLSGDGAVGGESGHVFGRETVMVHRVRRVGHDGLVEAVGAGTSEADVVPFLKNLL